MNCDCYRLQARPRNRGKRCLVRAIKSARGKERFRIRLPSLRAKPLGNIDPRVRRGIEPAQQRHLPALHEELVAATTFVRQRANEVALRTRAMGRATARTIENETHARPCRVTGPRPQFGPVPGVLERGHFVLQTMRGNDGTVTVAAHLLFHEPAGIWRMVFARAFRRSRTASGRGGTETEHNGSVCAPTIGTIERDLQISIKRHLNVGRDRHDQDDFCFPHQLAPSCPDRSEASIARHQTCRTRCNNPNRIGSALGDHGDKLLNPISRPLTRP